MGADVGLIIKLPLEDGSEYEWYVARPQGLLRKFAAHSPALRRLLCKLKTSPDDLADIIHYIDDVSVGHLLAPVHGRAFTTYRYTFKQFGSHLLSSQQCWLEYGILRTSVTEKVVGGPSYVLRVLMHQFFTSAENFTTTGVFVNCGEGEMIFAKKRWHHSGPQSAHGKLRPERSERDEPVRTLRQCCQERSFRR